MKVKELSMVNEKDEIKRRERRIIKERIGTIYIKKERK